MTKVKNKLLLAIVALLAILFFYPVLLKGHVPFPGDLLLAEYQPWRSSSFDGMNAGAVPNKAQYFDTIRQIYPWKTEAISQIKNGSFPLWNPYNFSGTPLFANFQSAVLYPLGILYLIFPQHISWTILVMLQPLIAFVAFFFFANKVGVSKTGSIISGIGYSFSLFMTTFLEYNTLGHFLYLLPISLLLIELAIENKKLALPILSLVIASTLFAGHLQLFGGNVIFILIYVLVRFFQAGKVRKSFINISLFVVLGIGIGAIQLLPGIELISLSARSSHDTAFLFDNLLIRPDQLILYFTPDIFGNPAVKNYLLPFSYPSKALYVGALPLILFAIGFRSKKSKPLLAAAIGSLFFALLVFLNPVSYLLYSLNLPFISTSSPSNFIYLVSFGICLLAGLGYDMFFNLRTKKVFMILGIFALFFVTIFATTTLFHIPIIKNGFIVSAGIFLLSLLGLLTLKIRKMQKIGPVILITLIALDLFYFFHKFNSFVPPTFVYPPTPINEWVKSNANIDRTWGFKSAHIEPNFHTQTKTYSIEGYDPLFPKIYHDFIGMGSNNISRSDALIGDNLSQTNLKVLSATGTRYILDKAENASTQDTFPSANFQKIRDIQDFSVQENLSSSSRVFLTKSYMVYSNFQDFKNTFEKDTFNPSKSVLLESDPNLSSKPLVKQQLKVTKYSSSTVSVATTTDSDSLMYLSDTYYPGWNAYIDKVNTPILKANYAFRAIKVPSGEHTIEFKYEPKTFQYGLVLTIISLAIAALCTVKLLYVTKK